MTLMIPPLPVTNAVFSSNRGANTMAYHFRTPLNVLEMEREKRRLGHSPPVLRSVVLCHGDAQEAIGVVVYDVMSVELMMAESSTIIYHEISNFLKLLWYQSAAMSFVESEKR